jgi:hypothetical protein
VAADWQRKLVDFTEYRLPDIDRNGVDMQVLSLTSPGIQVLHSATGSLRRWARSPAVSAGSPLPRNSTDAVAARESAESVNASSTPV